MAPNRPELTDLIERSIAALAVIDEQGRYLLRSHGLAALTGHETDELDVFGRIRKACANEAEAQALIEGWRHHQATGEPVEQTARFEHAEGGQRWVRLHLSRQGTHRILHAVDITDLVRTQHTLAEREHRFRSFFESAPVGMAILDDSGILQANPAFCRMLGREHRDLLRRTMRDLTHPDDMAASQRATAAVLSGEQRVIAVEKRYLRADGGVVHARTTLTRSQLDPGGRDLSFVMVEDITERKAMEEDLLKVQKLESLGVLAGGIAHDFNNMLTTVLGNVEMVREALDASSPLQRKLDRAEKAALRARDLTLQLQTFASGGEPMRRVIRLADVLRESAELCFRGSRTLPEIEIEPDLPLAELDAGQIAQALNNLFINAIQAMPQGGTAGISLRAVTLEAEELPPLPAGRYLRVVVRDGGVGIPPEHLERIFDPYYTTKRSGRGLGLAIAFGVVKRHGGHLQASSEPSRGSTFTLYLPASPASEVDAQIDEEASLESSSGRVLVMDDEPTIRELVQELLSHFGYRVDTACHGDEALVMVQQAARQGDPYRAAILDLTIPGGRGGQAIVRELCSIDPELRTIVMSGYSTDAIMSRYEHRGFHGAVPKPCSTRALVMELQRVLGERG